MEPTQYVAPNGALQTVASPTVAERLRAAGWRPYQELAALAATDDTAREHLETAETYQAARKAEQEAREARFAPTRPDPEAQAEADAEAEHGQAAEAGAEPAARKRRTTTRS